MSCMFNQETKRIHDKKKKKYKVNNLGSTNLKKINHNKIYKKVFPLLYRTSDILVSICIIISFCKKITLRLSLRKWSSQQGWEVPQRKEILQNWN